MPGQMMNQQGNQMPVQQMQQDSMQQHMPMQQDFNKMMQQRMKLNPQAQVYPNANHSFIFCYQKKTHFSFD